MNGETQILLEQGDVMSPAPEERAAVAVSPKRGLEDEASSGP